MPDNKLLLSNLFLLAALGGASESAHAAGYFDGTHAKNGAPCPGNPSGPVYDVIETWAGYYADGAASLSTGDAGYVRAIAWNLSPNCHNDTVGFHFNLPPDASLYISPTNPVRCYVGNTTYYTDLPNVSGMSACLQTPQPTANGLFFGFTALPPGWFVEIRVPIVYQRRGPSALTVVTSSGYGNLTPSVSIPVAYRPAFANHASAPASDGFNATVYFDATHYFETGTLDVVYGTDPNNLASSSGSAALNSQWLAHPNSSATLSNLTPAATHYWRVRIRTTTGTYVGPLQSFVTPAASLDLPPPGPILCRRFFC